jgi:hypothetical protein
MDLTSLARLRQPDRGELEHHVRNVSAMVRRSCLMRVAYRAGGNVLLPVSEHIHANTGANGNLHPVDSAC